MPFDYDNYTPPPLPSRRQVLYDTWVGPLTALAVSGATFGGLAWLLWWVL